MFFAVLLIFVNQTMAIHLSEVLLSNFQDSRCIADTTKNVDHNDASVSFEGQQRGEIISAGLSFVPYGSFVCWYYFLYFPYSMSHKCLPFSEKYLFTHSCNFETNLLVNLNKHNVTHNSKRRKKMTFRIETFPSLSTKRVVLFNSLKSLNISLNLPSILSSESESASRVVLSFISKSGFNV